jgi:hypothetical protein
MAAQTNGYIHRTSDLPPVQSFHADWYLPNSSQTSTRSSTLEEAIIGSRHRQLLSTYLEPFVSIKIY